MEGDTVGRSDGALLSLGGLGNLKDKTGNLSDCELDGVNAHRYDNTDEERDPAADGGFDSAVCVQDINPTIDKFAIENDTAE